MPRAGKAKRKSVSKLNRYAELSQLAASASSKGKGKGKGSSNGKEKILKEMEEIKKWIRSKKKLIAETAENMRILKQVSYRGNVKIKCKDKNTKSSMEKIAHKADFKLL
ncbi:hypothetical protein EJD97_011489 [Solanum chilense]|uniref:Uncharacterized protein n=1 Tax=Solanum chilense TaxID=4083 RepID=A0A6N2AJ85_SOLCI|nr:hypothetical protein EJD97_011489 [Solanum chilense]